MNGISIKILYIIWNLECSHPKETIIKMEIGFPVLCIKIKNLEKTIKCRDAESSSQLTSPSVYKHHLYS